MPQTPAGLDHPDFSAAVAARLAAEPYGSCTAHRLQLRQYAESCCEHEVINDVECLVVLVACSAGCEVVEFHS